MENQMKALTEIFNTCEDDYSSSLLLNEVTKYFVTVSESCCHDDEVYMKVAKLMEQAAKLMSR